MNEQTDRPIIHSVDIEIEQCYWIITMHKNNNICTR